MCYFPISKLCSFVRVFAIPHSSNSLKITNTTHFSLSKKDLPKPLFFISSTSSTPFRLSPSLFLRPLSSLLDSLNKSEEIITKNSSGYIWGNICPYLKQDLLMLALRKRCQVVVPKDLSFLNSTRATIRVPSASLVLSIVNNTSIFH